MSMPINLEAPPVADESAAVRAARAFLDANVNDAAPETNAARVLPVPLPGEVADALIELLSRRGGKDDLARLGLLAAMDKSDKALAKKARRTIHVLRTRGVSVEVPRVVAVPPRVDVAADEVLSLETPRHRAGEYFVWYARASRDSGVEVFEGHCNDERGLVGFRATTLTRKGWRATAMEVQEGGNMSASPVPSSWARWLLEEAYQVSLRAGHRPPREYAELRHVLEPTAAPPRHPVLDLVDESAVESAGRVEDALALLETTSWTPDEETLNQADLELGEIAVSPLNVDERMRDQRIADALKKAAVRWFTSENRARLERRLLETAYLILRRPAAAAGTNSRDRMADAALCVKAARYVADESVAPEDNRVAWQLFARLLQPENLPSPPSAAPPAHSIATPTQSPGGIILP